MIRRHISIFDAWIAGAYDDLGDRSVVFFSAAFLIEPNPGWQVCWNAPSQESHELGKIYGGQLDDVLNAYRQTVGEPAVQKMNTPDVQKMNTPAEPSYLPWIEGTVVKQADPQRVWVLTGHRDFRTGHYEGRWPD